jgi:NADH-quinone oxidoreductase subunit F
MKILVGQGSCGVATGARKTADEFARQLAHLGLSNVEIEKTGCIGSCYLEPIVDVYDDEGNLEIRYVKVQPDKVSDIVNRHIVGGEPVWEYGIPEVDQGFQSKQKKIVLRNCGVINPERIEEYINAGGYQATKKALTSMTPEEVIEEMKISGLRGRGGAGFPTWFKWNAARQNEADQKYMVCNADEGDPGAFMDRSILEGDPHSLLEGMIIGAYAIGASEGVIYVRAKFHFACLDFFLHNFLQHPPGMGSDRRAYSVPAHDADYDFIQTCIIHRSLVLLYSLNARQLLLYDFFEYFCMLHCLLLHLS